MSRRAIVFEASRSGYSIDQLFTGYGWNKPITVGDLMGILEDYDEDDLFILSHDNGYTYGTVRADDYADWVELEDGEWVKE